MFFSKEFKKKRKLENQKKNNKQTESIKFSKPNPQSTRIFYVFSIDMLTKSLRENNKINKHI